MRAIVTDAGQVRIPKDRRRDPRFVPGDATAYLGWWEGETFRAELGTLRNVSAGGAAVEFEAELDVPDVVWLCVVGPGRVLWTPARRVGGDGRLARIQFAERIPYETFELLI